MAPWPLALVSVLRSLPTSRLLWSVLALDALCVVLALAHRLEVVASPMFSLGYDWGLGEIAQYAKEVLAMGAAIVLFRARREPVYLAVAGLLLALLVDDATRFHEVAGEAISGALSIPALPGIRGQDVGEVLALASWAVPLGLAGLVAYVKSDRLARHHARLFGAAVVVLAGFGVVADLVHQAFSTVWGLSFALEVVEEGGELVTMSVIAAAIVAVARRVALGLESEA